MEKKILYINILCSLLLVLTLGSVSAQDFISTIGGTLTVERDNSNAAEASDKVVDGSISTKFLLFDSDPLWIQYEFASAVVVDRYSLTSANDASGRDPKNWTIAGSNNGSTWTTLDTKANEKFNNRLETKVYNVANTTVFKFYRLNISSNNGATLFQLAEWRLLGAAAPEAPSALSATATSGSEVYLTWTDNSSSPVSSEDNFVLERSLNGTDFTELAVLSPNTKEYVDENLTPNTSYHYRVKAVNVKGESTSNTVNVSTQNFTGLFTDITDNGGEITSSARIAEQDLANQGLGKIIDNNTATKVFLRAPQDGEEDPWEFPIWYQYESTTSIPVKITKYTITSGNDAADRDPKDWTFEASTDGSDWDVLDTKVNYTFESRGQTKTFLISGASSEPYQYYRLNITANSGSGDFQFAEWEIYGVPTEAPAIPTNLDVTDSTYYSITLAWDDNANNETGYSLERSLDGTSFEVVTTTAADVTTYVDEDLASYKDYYYRIQAINNGSPSIYSEVIKTKTKINPFIPFPPSNVVAVANDASSISLTWTDESTIETGFQIERSRDGVEYSVLDSVAADVQSYEDTGLVKATTYYYRLVAYNDLGQSEIPSEVGSATTTGINEAPSFNTIEDYIVCAIDTRYQITVKGITKGVDEAYQTLSYNIVSDKPAMFDELIIEPTVTDSTILSFIAVTDTLGEATVTLTIKDNGGSNNGGSDTYVQTFKLIPDLTVITASSDTENPIERGETINLTADGGVSYNWIETPGLLSDPENQTITVKPVQDYPYVVEAVTPLGCTKTAEVVIKMSGDYNLEPNNILTPNNDGYNDVWVVWNINTYPENELKIYDASGRIVYSETGYANTWGGTSTGGSQLPSGVYYYVIDLGSGIPALTGSLTIINN
ncbi:gliding motility-associated C-terminal domain-containing protein [Fulvivirga ligni]|uniref:T9SS type B sorting domain-containing protein n=1 Tax=Fulvivirga ligni TaxID=2904246 RepID=UPI001F330F27|nr:gliding motility-associated C-terminal domain-containing protein [Fulvivirga ligni]UII19990.1 gliding motility-associated C-terminal domain-containing protein [Fulvivirga ligni]